MKSHIKFEQYKIRLQNIKQKEQQQKYRLGTISNIKLLGGGGANIYDNKKGQ